MKAPDILPESERRKRILLDVIDKVRAHVEAGEIANVCILAGREDGRWSSYITWDGLVTLLGVLSMTQFEVQHTFDERNGGDEEKKT